jgi:CDP-4-dehydro-6-deoxyglucose reductase
MLVGVQESNSRLVKIVETIYEKLAQDDRPENVAEVLKMIDQTKVLKPESELATFNDLSDELLNNVYTKYVRLWPSENEFAIEQNDTILEGALKSGFSLNYGCSDGSCGLCRAKVKSGVATQSRYLQVRLSPSEQKEGIVYTCGFSAVSDIELEAEISLTGDEIPKQTIIGRIKSIVHRDCATVISIKTPPSQRFRFLAGQSTRVIFQDQPPMEFPIASCPCEDRLVQIHIPTYGGNGYQELVNSLRLDDPVELQGPIGNFTLDIHSRRDLVFVAYDTGFSSLKSLIEQAISLEVAQHIRFYWIVEKNKNLYMDNLCKSWMDAIDSFTYEPIFIEKAGKSSAKNGVNKFIISTAMEFINDSIEHADQCDYYLAIHPEMSQGAESFLSSRGVPHHQISINSTIYYPPLR